MRISPNKGFTILTILLIVGLLISLFLLYEHFSDAADAFCNFGEGFDCGIVNKSVYSNFDGIFYLLAIDWGLPFPNINIADMHIVIDFLTSNAFLGFATLLLLLLLIFSWKNKKGFLFLKAEQIRKVVTAILVFSVVYGLYLFYIQHFILHTYCVFCLVLDLIIFTSVAIVLLIDEKPMLTNQ